MFYLRRFLYRLDKRSVLKIASVAVFVFILYHYKSDEQEAKTRKHDQVYATSESSQEMFSMMPGDAFTAANFDDDGFGSTESEVEGVNHGGTSSTTEQTSGKPFIVNQSVCHAGCIGLISF